jgi:hypothetical protein
MIKLKKILEATPTAGYTAGDAWPDGIHVKPGRKRYVSPSGLGKGMTQVDFPIADPIYNNDEEKAGELRDDTPPLSPIQRGFRGTGDDEYKIPPESFNGVRLSTGDEAGWPWAGQVSPDGAPEAGTPEKSSGGYRVQQHKPTNVKDLDKHSNYRRGTKKSFDTIQTYASRNAETQGRLKDQPKDWWNMQGKGEIEDGLIKGRLKDLMLGYEKSNKRK